jgi:hypothetical protein
MTPDSTRPISSHYPRAPFLSSTFGSAHFNPMQYIDIDMNMPVASNSMMDDATYLSHNSINDAPSDVSHLSNS